MGIVFGYTGTKEPAYVLMSTVTTSMTRFEIRRNPSYFIAEVPMSDSEGNSAFSILAKYIGVFGDPANEATEKLAMTSPVILETNKPAEKLAMTSPVITVGNKMAFVLPFHFQNLNEVPKPKDQRVHIRMIPSKVIAVSRFSGWYSDQEGRKQLSKLLQALKEKLIVDAKDTEETVNWNVAQYHPPFTIPFLRRNEIWVEIKEESIPKET